MLKQTLMNKAFLPLWVSHLLSVINDSFIRTVFLFFVTYKMTQTGTSLMITAVILYALLYCAGSLYAGQIADKMSRVKFLRLIRAAEIALMVMALLFVFLDSRILLTLILALLGLTGSCLRVINNALLPDTVGEKGLNFGNLWMKTLSVLGSGLSVLLLMSVLKFDAATATACSVAVLFSCISFGVTFLMKQDKPADSEIKLIYNPWTALEPVLDSLKHQFDRWAYIVGIAWFWILGSLVFFFSAEYGHSILNARWSVVTFLSGGVFTAGYLIGAFIYYRLTKKGNLFSWAVWAGLGISVFLIGLIIAGGHIVSVPGDKAITVHNMIFGGFNYWIVILSTFMLGGLSVNFIIPLYVMLQKETPKPLLGRMMAFSSVVNACGIMAAFLIVLCFSLLFVDLLSIMLLFAVANVFVALYMTRLLPLETRRHVFQYVFKKLFKARIEGLEHLKKAGNKALIVTNHTSYLDVLLISAFVDRKIVFAISDKLLNKVFVKFMTNLVEIKPLDPVSPFAVKDMAEELNQNKWCMIFTEGLIEGGNTRMKIYEAPAMMAVKGNAPIVPIRIDGASHALFSRVLGQKADFRWFPKITLTVLPPVKFDDYPADMPTREMREKSSSRLYDVMTQMTFDSYEKDKTIFQKIIRAMSMAGRFKPVLEDTARKPVKFISLFLKSFVLGGMLHRAAPDEKYLGIMIPTSNACALTVLGLHAYGKIPAMINFTSGPKQVISTCETIGLKTIITARKVVALAKLENLVATVQEAGIRILYLEDLAPTLTLKDKLRGVLYALMPEKAYKKTSGGKISADDTAVVLFTSGSEGFPKAVFLTHKNMISNAYQVLSKFDVYQSDILLNVLPMFHSFGLGAGLFLPLIAGLKAVLYPTPLHYRIIPQLCASTRATIFFGTDTFLSGYAKCANPYDFNSLRIVAVGAEKLKDETRKIWSEKFGVRVLEGYGATECSPFISVNTFLHQKKGSVGRIFNGLTYELKPVDGIKEGGELWLKGPNIMQGYMRYTDPLKLDPPEDGWYNTGDIVDIDLEGYVFIKGRSKRFAKIGGEMVSLLSVETVINTKWEGFITGAVSIPDPKKGEQIVLITNCPDITKDEMIKAFKAAGVTELGLPSRVIYTDNPPLLGTGKFDYLTAKELALKSE
ncbi:MAG: AMP-binding protein [Alphaproteobacteria bacterium]|nr:AMP-binding protein [Alphaproteobacteria bacterium]